MEGHKDKLSLGQRGEEAAVRYLKDKRFSVVGRRYRGLRGEIDIIAFDRETLVFIEVKTRTGRAFGSPEDSVTQAKQNQIRKIAQCYLVRHGLEGVPCRFDVISVMMTEEGAPSIRHFENAF